MSSDKWKGAIPLIISRTPLRMSFFGGGSDMESFYKHQRGAVLSTAINKYIYITVNKKFDNQIRASYSITEFVDTPEELKHELIREALLLMKIKGGIEITSISDIPSSGTGLGSSSSYIVGLLNAFSAYKGNLVFKSLLAEEACKIEINKCNLPAGKQDQYIASYGGFKHIEFNSNGSVFVTPVLLKPKIKKKLEKNLLLFYTGVTRASKIILKEQKRGLETSLPKRRILAEMVAMVATAKNALELGDLVLFAHLLHHNWGLKRKLVKGISTPQIDRWYKIGRDKGALGGKILGAGGGGFLLLYAPKWKHSAIRKALPELKYVPFKFEPEGSKIIYYGEK